MRFRSKFGVTSLCLLFVVLSVQRAGAQSAQERHDQIRASIESNNLSAAISQLKSLRTAGASTFALNNYDYLLARLAERRGDFAVSSSSYQSVVVRHSLLSQYALWHLAQSARSTGDLVLERERLRQLITTAPESLLREAATTRLAQSFVESSDYAAAISTLRPLSESKNPGLARQALALSAQAYLADNKPTEARELFSKLVAQMPDASRPDDFALSAARGLDQLDAGNSTATQTKTPLSEADHLLRASIYNFNRDFAGARTHYLVLIDNYEQSSSAPDALFQIGRGYYQQGNYDDALKYFQRLQDRYATSTSARDALGLAAATYNRLKRSDEAIAAYKLSIERFPNAPNPERPYLNIIDTLRDAGRDDEALDWVKQTRVRFKDQIGGTLALFAQAKIHLAHGSWAAAISDLDELQQAKDLGGARVPGGTTASELLFLRAFALEQLGQTEDAVNAYLSIAEGRSEYYGFRANERLRTLDSNPKTHPAIAAKGVVLGSTARQAIESGQADVARRAAQNSLRITFDSGARNELLGIARRAYATLPNYNFPTLQLLPLGRGEVLTGPVQFGTASLHQALADELFFLGLYDEGVPEFTAARSLESGSTEQKRETSTGQSKSSNAATKDSLPASDLDYTIAFYSLRGGLTNQAVRFAERIWKPIASDYLLELAPPQMAELLYPAPFRESLLKHAPPRGIDPRFLLAVARQESRFRSDAKSNAAARGLMQFISATADDVAKQLGKRAFSQDELYNPDTAIEFGVQYLSSLFKQFPAMPQAVAGSYNGGPDNIARWVARSRTNDPDRYVAEIGFSQTKEYVFIVMSNFWVYQQLYSEQLERK